MRSRGGGFGAFTEGPSVDSLKGWRLCCFYRRTLCRCVQQVARGICSFYRKTLCTCVPGVLAFLLLQKDPVKMRPRDGGCLPFTRKIPVDALKGWRNSCFNRRSLCRCAPKRNGNGCAAFTERHSVELRARGGACPCVSCVCVHVGVRACVRACARCLRVSAGRGVFARETNKQSGVSRKR